MLVGGDAELVLQVDDGVRVDVAHAGAHDHALERGKAHGSVHALAVLDGADGAAGAQVAGDDLGVLDIQARELGAHAGDELVARAVRAVAADAILLVVLVREAVHVGVSRHRLMEGGVEGHDLRDARENGLHGVDAQQVSRVMERGEVAAEGDLLQDVVVHEDGAGEEIAALDDTVAHSLDVLEGREDARLGIREGRQDEFHAHFVVGNRNVLHDLVTAGRGVLEDARREADLLGDTFRDDVEHIIVLHVEELVLDGRTSAIDDKDDHRYESLINNRSILAKLIK